MKLENQFTVHAPIETAWDTLTDLDVVAPLLPGAQLTGRDGDAYLGKMKVKVGPVTSEFSGRAALTEADRGAHRAVIEANGRDSRGAGNASATITARLVEVGDATRVTVDTDMKVVGKLAQFGSGVIAQVSEKMMNQFAASLEAKLAAGEQATEPVKAAPAEPARSGAPFLAPEPAAEPEPLDLLGLAGPALAKRLLPLAAALLAGLVVGLAIRYLRRH
ncbi:polyketide cyclase / dehydrase and lipid transport family protein [Rhodococcus sp. MTM3W5.2]|uniref:SRPBCC family protein n=1 Tax=Rhodococcus sp. MTM3W5.2 TaxID=1805827 RepID=UPI0009794016|nr:SRPBCC family protein [Rhodococcus sp. MTM3W5.2]AQA22869.1 polyketide cyclase / dehydrase and lipid transport family protein [Rhodococcus sp. MTM3W5.2]